MSEPTIKLKPLPETFTRAGIHYTQVRRDGLIAIFKCRRPGWHTEHFEVVRIQQRSETEMFGKIVEAHEAIPGNEQWGTHGWTYMFLSKAEAKFNQLVWEE